jgi:hypothetical protein
VSASRAAYGLWKKTAQIISKIFKGTDNVLYDAGCRCVLEQFKNGGGTYVEKSFWALAGAYTEHDTTFVKRRVKLQ